MDVMPTMEHHSSIAAEKTYTSFMWSLKDWSILYNHYSNNIVSPEFDIMGEDGCTCKLIFKMSSSIFGSQNNCFAGGSVEYKFTGDIEFKTMQMIVSFVDESMIKLLTIRSLLHDTIPKDYPEIRFDQLFSMSSITQYVKNDTLTFLFELVIVKGISESSLRTNMWNGNVLACRELLEMLNQNQLCDVVFEVEDRQMPAHKVILAANSPVFRAMFKEEAARVVKVEETEFNAFKHFRDYMYTGQIDHMEDVVNNVVVLADRYEVTELKRLCEKYMATKLNNSNAIRYLLVAHHLECPILYAKAAKYIRFNTSVLSNSEDFKRLSDYPDLIRSLFSD